MSPDFEQRGPFMVRAGASARAGDPRDPVLVGELWARYKTDEKLFCSVQDDDFTILFRERFHGHVRTP